MNQSDDETRKKVKQFEESLLESERNPNAKENLAQLIERAAQPLHRVLTNVIPKHKFIHVVLKILRRNTVIRPIHRAF